MTGRSRHDGGTQLLGIADEYGTIWSGAPGASERVGDLIQRPDEETFEVRLVASPPGPLTQAEAVHRIRDLLSGLSNAPHADFEGHGGLCPVCGVVTRMQRVLEDFRDD